MARARNGKPTKKVIKGRKREQKTVSDKIRTIDSLHSKLKHVITRDRAEGYMIIKGYNDNNEEFIESDKDHVLTVDEISRIRYIIMTERRSQCVDNIRNKFIIVDEEESNEINSEISTYVTSSEFVLSQAPCLLSTIRSMKGIDQRFDHMLGLTYTLWEYPEWYWNLCQSNSKPENGMSKRKEIQKLLDSLGCIWRGLLRCSDSALSIDREFTRPGIKTLLEDFRQDLLLAGKYEFAWN